MVLSQQKRAKFERGQRKGSRLPWNKVVKRTAASFSKRVPIVDTNVRYIHIKRINVHRYVRTSYTCPFDSTGCKLKVRYQFSPIPLWWNRNRNDTFVSERSLFFRKSTLPPGQDRGIIYIFIPLKSLTRISKLCSPFYLYLSFSSSSFFSDFSEPTEREKKKPRPIRNKTQ